MSSKRRNVILACLLALALVVGISAPMDVKAEGEVVRVCGLDGASNCQEYTLENFQSAVSKVNTDGGTLTLLADVQVTSKVSFSKEDITIDLGNHKIYAGNTFAKDETTSSNNHVVDIIGNNITITNGTIEAGANNRHALNVWYATGVVVKDMKLDHSKGGAGAPLTVAGAGVTIEGNVEFVTGTNSWYGVNVDSVKVSGQPVSGSINVDKETELTFSGSKQVGIYMENTQGESATSTVTFGEGSKVSSEINGFVPVAAATTESAEGGEGTVQGIIITTPENAGLVEDGNGTYVPAPTPTPTPSTPSRPSSKPVETVDPCTERIGTGWVYDDEVGHCVYKGSGQTIPNTSTK